MHLRLFFLFTFAFIIIGCDEKKDPVGSSDKPHMPVIMVAGPNTTSQDPYALQIRSTADLFNGLQSAFIGLTEIPGTRDGNSYTWTYQEESLTQTVVAVLNNDGSYSWAIILDGSDGSTTYDNFTFMEGHTAGNGNGASWQIYDAGTGHVELELSVDKLSSGQVVSHLITYDGPSTISSSVELVNNPDGSGEYKSSLRNGATLRLVLKAVWIANGTGGWEMYGQDGTTVIQTGSWN